MEPVPLSIQTVIFIKETGKKTFLMDKVQFSTRMVKVMLEALNRIWLTDMVNKL